MLYTIKPVKNGHSQKDRKLVAFKTNYRLMEVKSIAECSLIKLLFVFKIFVLSILSGRFTQVLLYI